MSYDYWLVRTNQAVNSLRELDESAVASFKSWDEVVGIISKLHPQIVWETDEKSYWGNGNELKIGRFDIHIERKAKITGKYRRAYGILTVNGSFHSNQIGLIINIAKAIDFTAVDVQNGDVLFSQATYGKWQK